MTQNFREIVRNDEILVRLLSLADNHSLDGHDLISIGEINGICEKVTTINTKDPNSYTRRIAWTLTGRLLLGLTMYHNIRVQMCFEECILLKEQCRHHVFVIEKTKTTKRKTKKTVTHSKNKRQRTLEVEEEVSSIETIRFWEEPLQFDPHASMASDLNLAPSDQITLREINEPPMDDVDMIVEKLNTGFGDEDMDTDFDEEFNMFHLNDHDYSASDYSKNIVMRRDSFDLDENMNDIAYNADVHSEIESVISRKSEQGPAEVEKPEKRPENPIELLTAPFPRSVVALKRKSRKRKSSVFKDDEIAIDRTTMYKRTSNTFIECKDRRSVCLTEDKLLKLKQADIFSVPVMNATHNREMFMRSAKVRQMATDWTTIQDAFDSGAHDASNENGSSGSSQIDILRHETSNRPNTRNQSRSSTSLAFDQQLESSTPIRDPSFQQSRSSFQFNDKSTSQFDLDHIPSLQLHTSAANQSNVFTPPSYFQDSVLAPARGFENVIETDFDVPFLPQQTPSEQCNEHSNGSQINQNDSPSIECTDLATLLGDDSVQYAIMKKLLKLWQKNIHPIKIDCLLAPRCNRFLAAKTFNSLLILKKKGLVQLENSDDGRIVHIPKGDKLNTIV